MNTYHVNMGKYSVAVYTTEHIDNLQEWPFVKSVDYSGLKTEFKKGRRFAKTKTGYREVGDIYF